MDFFSCVPCGVPGAGLAATDAGDISNVAEACEDKRALGGADGSAGDEEASSCCSDICFCSRAGDDMGIGGGSRFREPDEPPARRAAAAGDWAGTGGAGGFTNEETRLGAAGAALTWVMKETTV